jgi:predicted phosphodiesterase
MKYLFFSDIHGGNPIDLEKVIDKENIDIIGNLGDYDLTDSINNWALMEEKYLNQGKKIITVPGNHDHAIFMGEYFYSQVVEGIGKDSDILNQELLEDKKAYEYIRKLLNSAQKKELYLDNERFGDKYKTIVVHGGLDGNFNLNCPEHIRNLWYRIKCQDNAKDNFNAMKLEDYKIMIRGHDHKQDYIYKYIKNNKEKFDTPNIFKNNLEIELKEGQHIINPGPFYHGYYAIIDTNVKGKEFPVVKFCRL